MLDYMLQNVKNEFGHVPPFISSRKCIMMMETLGDVKTTIEGES